MTGGFYRKDFCPGGFIPGEIFVVGFFPGGFYPVTVGRNGEISAVYELRCV